MKASAMIKTIKRYFESRVPGALSAAGLTLLNDFLETPPTNDSLLQMGVYGAEGADNVNNSRDAFIVQVQLPGQTSPIPYLDEIWPILLKFDPVLVGHTTKEASYQVWYPGELGDGYGGSFVFFEMEFSNDNDDAVFAEDDSL